MILIVSTVLNEVLEVMHFSWTSFEGESVFEEVKRILTFYNRCGRFDMYVIKSQYPDRFSE